MYEKQYLSTVLAPRALYFCVCLYSANPQGLHTVCWCSPRRALYFCVLQYGVSPNGLCAVRAYKGFVLLCTVGAPRALRGASLQRLFTVCTRACGSVYCTSSKRFVRCEPTKALYSVCQVLLCTVRAPRALCGASLQRLYTVCWCSPPGFAPSAYVLVYDTGKFSLPFHLLFASLLTRDEKMPNTA